MSTLFIKYSGFFPPTGHMSSLASNPKLERWIYARLSCDGRKLGCFIDGTLEEGPTMAGRTTQICFVLFFNLVHSRYLLILVAAADISSEVDWGCITATTPLSKSTSYTG